MKSDHLWWQGQQAFFAQTAQLHLERLLHLHPCLYVHGSSGRAEERVDGRHLSEFELFELELRGGFEQLVDLIKTVFWMIGENLSGYVDLSEEEKKRAHALKDITVVKYADAIRDLNQDNDYKRISYGDDLGSDSERRLCLIYKTPVLITHFPNNQHEEQTGIEVEKFFNMRPCNSNRDVLSCDLILPNSGESLGGAERIWEVAILKERLEKSKMYQLMLSRGLSMKDFDSYMSDMEKHGTATGKHAGCGIGIPRVVQYLLGVENIEDATIFPSTRVKLL